MARLSVLRGKAWARFRSSELGEILGHAKNYFAGDVAVKALGFISMPVFTRLLTTEDYGTVGIYTATVGLVAPIITLNSANAVSRYYYEKDKTDFPAYLSSMMQWQFLLLAFSFLIFALFPSAIMRLLALPMDVWPFLLAGLFSSAIIPFYQGLLVASKNSKPYVLLNAIQAYGGFALSWLLLAFVGWPGYWLRIAGFSTVQLGAALSRLSYLRRQARWSRIDWSHVKYSLAFALPRLFYVLSAHVLSSFDRIMIGSMVGKAEAGIYTASYHIGGMSMLFIGSVTTAFLPNFYALMNKGETATIDRLNTRILWIIAASSAGLMLMGKPVLRLLAPPHYWEGASIIPLIVLGYVFYALSGVYNRYFGYAKSTILQAVTAVFAGALNVGLNYIFIPKFGITAAAATTIVAYAAQALLTWLFSRWFDKSPVTPLRKLLPPVGASVVMAMIVWQWL